MRDLEESLRRVYNRDYPLVNALAGNEIPIPNAYRTTFEYVLNADLLRSFQSEKINIHLVERTMAEMVKWELSIEDTDKVERLAGESIFKELKRIAGEGDNPKRIDRLNRLFPLLKKFNIKPNLSKSQNLYFEISLATRSSHSRSEEWMKLFNQLGENLSVKVE